MFVIIDERELVTNGYAARFGEEGVASASFCGRRFREWVASAVEADMQAVEAFLIGDCPEREVLPRLIRPRSQAPIIAMNDAPSLEQTLNLFGAGVDDVVRKPVHVREIMARVRAIRGRAEKRGAAALGQGISISLDGGDPIVNGEVVPLPRRERRVLEYLAANSGRRVTKAQIFNAVYGLFDEEVEENVIESHISKLRKKLRARLGYDPIDSQRFLGYLLMTQPDAPRGGVSGRSGRVASGDLERLSLMARLEAFRLGREQTAQRLHGVEQAVFLDAAERGDQSAGKPRVAVAQGRRRQHRPA